MLSAFLEINTFIDIAIRERQKLQVHYKNCGDSYKALLAAWAHKAYCEDVKFLLDVKLYLFVNNVFCPWQQVKKCLFFTVIPSNVINDEIYLLKYLLYVNVTSTCQRN